ncbi:type VI secretion system Vgr family protein [Roseomonas rosulenta]|uniref:type VI secretion system Vgr family protein n=1 Tax=Roseomonas rosulenta TaxID=2748667 RepID=UPI0018E0389C
MSYSQTTRVLEIQTTLGPDLAMLTELEGEERISQPYLFNISFVSEAEPAQVARLLGTAVSIKMGWPEAESGIERRCLHGHIKRLRRGMAGRGDGIEWHAEVVPTLWFLSRTSDCRIFQEKTIPDIIMEVLQLHGVTSVEKKLLGTYQPREYVVQYRESALDFIQRLMEQEGIFYWHEHSEDDHKLVLADSNVSAPTIPLGEVSYLGEDPRSSVMSLDEEIVVRSGKWTLRDFNFETPSLSLEATQPTTINVAEMKKRERFDYPGIYLQTSAGTDVAKHRIENEETFHLVRRGDSGVAEFVAGARVTITGTPNPEVLLTEVRHRAQDYSHWTDQDWAASERHRGIGRRRRDDLAQQREPFYGNEFVCIPQNVKYRPERVTPRPFVQGPQTAIVTGPGGEEIHTDKYGRVKVQFHWDRLGQKNENSSCWIRVSQGWAGQNWGQFHIPRIGQEVIVDFLEGDPDRPIITGRVYNAENMYPYALPGEKTKSGIKTRSSKGGGTENFNEIRFEDLKGSEQIYVHAEKDLDTVVENNETRKVGVGSGTGNRTTEIKNDETLTVGNDKNTTVNGHFTELVQKTEFRTVNGNVTETFMANEERKVIGSFTETVFGDYSITVVPGAYDLKAVGGISMWSPAAISVTSMVSITLTAPSIKQIGPSWFKTGLASGDAYVLKTGTAAVKNDNSGISVNNGGVKIDNFGLKLDTFGMAIKTGGVEIKNKALKTNSEAFAAKRGLKLYSA